MLALRRLLFAVLLSSPLLAASQVVGYAVNSDDLVDADHLLRIDLTTGSTSFVGELATFLEDVEGMAFDADGQLFAVDSATKTLFRVSVASAEAELIGSRQANLGFPPASSFDFGMTFTCAGELLLVAEQTQSLYMVSTDTGAARVIGKSGGLGDTMTAIASYGDQTYALAADSGHFYSVDTEKGTASLIGTIDEFAFTDAGMAFDTAGTLWAISSDFSTDPSRIFTIDPATAAVKQVATTRPGVESLAISGPIGCNLSGVPIEPAEVPLNAPWALVLLALGLLLIGGARLCGTARR